MKIAMLLSNDCSCDPRVEKEAAALGAQGHDVVVVAWDRTGGAALTEEMEGFRIERVGPRAPFGAGLRSLPRFRAFWREAAARAVSLEADVVHCHDTDTVPAGTRALRRLPGALLVLDFHELYRLSRMVPQRGPIGAVARGVVDLIERRACRRAAAVIVANPGTVRHYEGLGVGDRLFVVANAPDPSLFRPMPRPEGAAGFRICFVGRMRYARTLVSLMEAVQRDPGMSVFLAGGGPDAAEVERAAAGLERVTTAGHVPYAEIPALYAACDVVYAAYDTLVGNVLYAVPGKVFEAMACAKPVLVSSGTWVGEFVEREGVGLAAACDDPGAVAEALVRLRSHPDEAAEMGRRGRGLVEREYNWESAARVLTGVYGRLGSRPGPRGGGARD